MSVWLNVIGIGEDGLAGLSPAAHSRLAEARLVVGGARHLALLPEAHAVPQLVWESPLAKTIETLLSHRGTPVAVLATGDPLHCGIGATLLGHLPAEEMRFLPNLSAFTLVCARLGWDREKVTTLSLHGRPFDRINRELAPDRRLVLLSADRATPAAVAVRLTEAGFGDSVMHVLEHMGGPKERHVEGVAAQWDAVPGADLNTIAVDCRATPAAQPLSCVPGLPDSAFSHDGQLTKAEIRAVTLAALAPLPGQVLWDVGAGSGAIAIEWLRAAPDTRAIAIEQAQQRLRLIERNAAALGTPELEIIAGSAPEALAGLPAPDAIFIGGGAAMPGMFDACWRALKPGGRLVANLVTLEGEAAILAWHTAHGGELRRLAVSRATAIGGRIGWKPLRPVTQYIVRKT